MSEKVVQVLVSQIIEKIEAENLLPWQKPWSASQFQQKNYATGNVYQGFNQFVTAIQGYTSTGWITLNQIRKMKASILEGEFKKSTSIAFWKKKNIFEKNEDTGKNEIVGFYFRPVRFYNVWNIEQTDIEPEQTDIEPEQTDIEPEQTDIETNDIASSFIMKDGKLRLNHGGDQACYSPKRDTIVIPEKRTFHSPEGYHATLFHELVHSTGHDSRLNRKTLTNFSSFGDHDYSQEELVAEIGACVLCSIAGIQNNINNSASYLAGWIKKLKEEPSILLKASSQSQKAVDLITG